MAAKRMIASDFDQRRVKDGWARLAALGDFQAFTNFVNYSGNVNHQRFGSHIMTLVKKAYGEVEKEAGPEALNRGPVEIFLDEAGSQKFVSVSKPADNVVFVWSFANPPAVTFRRTKGIVSNDGDPEMEADVIMTAASLGFAASYIAKTKNPLQFDMDPLEASKDPATAQRFEAIVGRIDAAVAAYLEKTGRAPGRVKSGASPGYTQGAVIMGVYTLAGKDAPQSISAPVLSPKGQALWEQIRTLSVPQYMGRGAYTGFVDNKNTEGDTNPVGPRSTARFRAPKPGELNPDPHPRWLPPIDSPQWQKRKRAGTETYVPWGLIGGERAGEPHKETGGGATNEADFITISMRNSGMVFHDDVKADDIAMYTHGMIQAIYKAYDLGPNCEPYEIAVGDLTKKMASCLTCSLFMYATGYPPTSIHLGRGESWAPLFHTYNPNGPTGDHETAVIRDLNNAWYASCLEWLRAGLDILDDAYIAETHKAARDAVRRYLHANRSDPTVGGILILDAVTIHASESDRINRTLK